MNPVTCLEPCFAQQQLGLSPQEILTEDLGESRVVASDALKRNEHLPRVLWWASLELSDS